MFILVLSIFGSVNVCVLVGELSISKVKCAVLFCNLWVLAG